MWDQIRRIVEDVMERGATKDDTLLGNPGSGRSAFVAAARTWLAVTACSTSVAQPLFTKRLGDEASDGGHIVVPSIGQDIPLSAMIENASAAERSGITHMVPVTWQKAKKHASKMWKIRRCGIIKTATKTLILRYTL